MTPECTCIWESEHIGWLARMARRVLPDPSCEGDHAQDGKFVTGMRAILEGMQP